MSKWKCETPKCKKPCYAEPPERCCPTGCLLSIFKKPKWRKEDDPATTSSQLPKLTAEVFDRKDCPVWAKFAAVDEDGKACYYSSPPILTRVEWLSRGINYSFIQENDQLVYFDASDWGNSLIARPVKKETLPDWCKVGEWVE